MSRGLNNNNPGNIRKGGDTFVGEITSTDSAFKQFSEMAYGYRAMIKTIQTYIKVYGCNTIASIVSRWAPPIENNTSSYISTVSSRSGLSSGTVISATDYVSLGKIVSAMSFVENGVPAVMSDIQSAVDMLPMVSAVIEDLKKKLVNACYYRDRCFDRVFFF